MLAKIIKYLGSGLLGVAALSLVLVLGVVGVNMFDEDLDPNVRELLSSNETDLAESQNAYFSMLALKAPAGEDIHNAGIRVVNKYRESLAEADTPARDVPNSIFGSDALEFAGDLDEICFPKVGPPCLRFCCASRLDLANLIDANQELLRRYESLYTYPDYRDHTGAFLVPSDILRIHRLKLAGSADSFDEGNITEALDAIRKDIRFWRGILGSEINAVTYALAGVAVNNNLNLLSELISKTHLTGSELEMAEKILLPLTDEEKSVHGVMVAELRQLHAFNRRVPPLYDQLAPNIQSPTLQKLLVRIFYRPNATLNFLYSGFDRNILDRESLPQRADSSYWTSGGELVATEYLYNPIGKIITDWVRRYPRALDAILRADARYRLVALQLRLRDSQIPEALVDEFLASAPAYFRNPFTGEKIQWEAENKRLVIRVPNPRYSDEIWVEYR